jgi:Uridine phosphorylase
MALIKNNIPILEYDEQQLAVIMPNRKRQYSFPEKAVFPFLSDEVEKYAENNNCEIIGEFMSVTKVYPIFKTRYQNEDICLCQAPVGTAPAVQLMEFLISYGATKIISAGTCGALVDINENEFLIPTEALRCEGTSYHYLPPSRTVTMEKSAVSAIEKALIRNDIPFSHCKTWTTDGFYRETKDMVAYRVAEGYSVVEMECSALQLVQNLETRHLDNYYLRRIPWQMLMPMMREIGECSHFLLH